MPDPENPTMSDALRALFRDKRARPDLAERFAQSMRRDPEEPQPTMTDALGRLARDGTARGDLADALAEHDRRAISTTREESPE